MKIDLTSDKVYSLLTPKKAADILGIKLETLQIWRCTKRYPLRYVKIGSRVFYREKDIANFIESRVFGESPIIETKGDCNE